MKKILIILTIILTPLTLYGQLIGLGTITSPFSGTFGPLDNLIWSGNIYINGNIYVDNEQLTISPGSTIIFTALRTNLIITGTGQLNAVGTPSSKITFTKGTGNSSWGHISFQSMGAAGASIIDNCIIEFGSKTGSGIDGYGGGIQADFSNLVISNSSIRNNYALFGGGIFINKSKSPTVLTCDILNNSSANSGGGIYLWDYSYPSISNCIIESNRSLGTSYGGGGLCIGTITGVAKITNCTIVNNTANAKGNNIYVQYANASTITNTVMWGFSSINDVYFEGSYKKSNLINSALQRVYGPAGTIPLSNFTNSILLNSSNNDSSGPNFNATNGTDWSINFISPCRDAGITPSPSIPTDFIGNSRIGPYDIGAYEDQYSRWKTTASSTDWATPGNWDQGVPTSSQDVIIPSGATNYPTGSSAQDFTIGAGKLMVLNPGAQATLGALTNSGTLRLESDATGISSLICSSYLGNDAQVQLFLKGGAGTYRS